MGRVFYIIDYPCRSYLNQDWVWVQPSKRDFKVEIFFFQCGKFQKASCSGMALLLCMDAVLLQCLFRSARFVSSTEVEGNVRITVTLGVEHCSSSHPIHISPRRKEEGRESSFSLKGYFLRLSDYFCSYAIHKTWSQTTT